MSEKFSSWTKTPRQTNKIYLMFCLSVVLLSSRKCFANMETSPFPFAGLQYLGLDALQQWLKSKKGSFSCHTCCDMGVSFLRSPAKDQVSHLFHASGTENICSTGEMM